MQVSEVVQIALKFLEKWTKNELKGKECSEDGYRLACLLVTLIDKSITKAQDEEVIERMVEAVQSLLMATSQPMLVSSLLLCETHIFEVHQDLSEDVA